MPNALVVGGTGPTGPFIVNGLRERGYRVTIFHRGTHEIAEIPDDVEHLHGDPHFRETIDEAIGGRTFDVIVACYGRLRHLAEASAGRTGRFVAVGGFVVYRGFLKPRDRFPAGLPVPVSEDAPLVASEGEQRFAWLMVRAEEAVMAAHPTAAILRYPYVYGPHQVVPREWCVVRRILDGRRRIVVPDGGLALCTHGYAANLAHSVLLAIDRPDASAGQIYNCGDEHQLSLAQIIDVIARSLDREVELVSMPGELASPAKPMTLGWYRHAVLDLTKIRRDLGYRDLVPAEAALAQTARWYRDHPPEPGGEAEDRLGDPFDYAAEDTLIDRYLTMSAELSGGETPATGIRFHPYPHPTEAGLRRDHRRR